MAVPKKRTSKTRKNLRRANWKAKASLEAFRALTKAKMVLRLIAIKNNTAVDANQDQERSS